MAAELADLRSLSDWFARTPLSENRTLLATLVRRLGATAVPLLGREVRQPDVARRDAAREALALLAGTDAGARARERVLAELRAIAAADPGSVVDEAKVCALGLLAELGEPGAARFRDPRAMQRRSALALAAQLDTAADVASAVDFMVRQLPDEDILQIVELVADAVPTAAARLAAELAARLDVSSDLRTCVADTAAELTIAAALPAPPSRRTTTQPLAAVLLDSAARMVVVTTRKVTGERRWRRWAILIGPSGAIDDCLHEDTTDDRDGAALIAQLCGDGYRIASHDPTHARAAVTAAARLAGPDLPPAYYLGRDLLDLGDAHLGTRHARRAAHDRVAATLGRASELLADGEPVRARALLERSISTHAVDPGNAECAALEAACLVADDKLAEALDPLRRAAAADPSWPLHHWNLGVVLYRLNRLGDAAAAHQSLQRFIATSAAPTALAGDPAQPARLADAERLLSELERAARLAGRPLIAPRARPRSRARRRAPKTSERARSERPPR
jgi:hypothetical protein